MKAVFRYPGSKWGLADWIISHFPAGYEKMVYLEPFAGSAAVFFNKRPGAVETINDLDSDIVNLFRVLREMPNELKRVLDLTPYSREEYDRSFDTTDDPLEKARRFVVRTTQAIGAKLGTKCGWRNHKQMKIGGTACKWGGITETLDMAASRLRGDTTHLVQIEHMDALRLIARYNSPDVLMYLDPPYVRSTRKSGRLYKHEMDDSIHIEMLELIAKSRAKIILSGYPSQLYDDHLPGWITDTTTTHTTSAETVTEKIWMNYDRPFMQTRII
jgi:DNA adenine methylase